MAFAHLCNGAQQRTNGSNENETVLSEDALRQLSKSLTGFIQKNVDDLEQGAFTYGHCLQAEEEC